MTVNTSNNRIEYSGNGTTTVFAYNFRILDQSHIEVILVSSAGVETVQTITTHYTVAGVGDAGGGNLTMLTAPASGESLVLRRNMPFTQDTNYTSGDPFPAETHEQALDELTMNDQELKETIDRSLRAPKQDSTVAEMPNASDRDGKLLTFDSNGDPYATDYTHAQLAALVANSTITDPVVVPQVEYQDGSAAVAKKFTLQNMTYTPGANNLFVFNNIGFIPAENYTQTSSTEVTMNFDFNDTDRFVFISGMVTTSAGVSDTSGITHTDLSVTQNLADFLRGNIRGDSTKRYRYSGCVIRQTGSGTGWAFIDDASHAPSGFTSVALNGTKVRLTHSFTGDKITSFQVTPDDSFTALDVSVGASVGTNITDLEFYAPIAGGITGSGSQGILASTGSTGDFSQVVDTAAGTIVVTHSAQTHVSSLGTPVVMGNVDNDNHGRWTVSSQSKTGFTLNYVSDLSALVDGGTSTATTSNVGVSVAFDTTGGSEGYVITHPATASSNLNVQVTAVPPTAATAYYDVRVESITTTTFKVAIFNAAGTRQTAASSSYDFMVRREGDFHRTIPSTTCGNVYRSAVPVDANELYNPSGNFWISAILEDA